VSADTAAPSRTIPKALDRSLPLVLCVVLLAGCGSPSKRSVYYQNDGPPDRTPADLADAADAVPRVEPLHPRANRPYTVLGRSYTPLNADVPFRQKGAASWYGRQFHGNRTASGEIYDMFAMTAAHPTLPIPSYVRVTNQRNGRSVIVRVNDRGPFKDSRIIDLSYGAAIKLGIAAAGTGEVEIERLTSAQIASGAWRGAPAGVAASPPIAADRALPASAGGASSSLPGPALASAPTPASDTPRWSVQVGAFAQQASADDFAARVATVLGFSDGELPATHREARVERDENLFRVLVGALPDRATALSLALQLERLLGQPAVPFSR
jgi:rare lipoprotein A